MKATDRYLYTSMQKVGSEIFPKTMTNTTVRDEVAMVAMNGMCCQKEFNQKTPWDSHRKDNESKARWISYISYLLADAMIEESNK